jgi:hypothetical protein
MLMDFARDCRSACPSCGSAAVTGIRNVRDHVSGESFQVRRCDNCQLTFLGDPPVARELWRFYDEAEGKPMHQRPSAVVTKARDVIMGAEVKRLTRFVNKGSTVADIGAGDGSLVSVMRQQGFAPIGADIYEPAQWRHSDIPYVQYDPVAPFSTALPDDLHVEAVTMRHVLEHVPEPREALGDLAGRGVNYVFIVVPNLGSRLASRLGSYWYFWDPPRHITFFTPATLSSLASRAGYDIVDLTLVGLDEVVTSLHRMLLLRNLDSNHRPVPPALITATRPTGLIASAASALVAPLGTATIKAVLKRRR